MSTDKKLLDRRATDEGEHFVESTIDLDFEEPRSAAADGGEHVWNDDGEKCIKCGASDWMTGPCTPTVSDASSATTPNVNEISSSLVVGSATSEAVAFTRQGEIDQLVHMRAVEPEYGDMQITVRPQAEAPYDVPLYTHPAQQQRQPQGELGKGANIEQG